MALPVSTKNKVSTLLKEGKLSKRAIHRKTGVSRVTIDKIEHSLLFPEKKPSPPPKPIVRPEKAVFVLCPTCKRKLMQGTNCLTCHIQKKQLSEFDSFFTNLLQPGG